VRQVVRRAPARVLRSRFADCIAPIVALPGIAEVQRAPCNNRMCAR
jgi:hypothetical protein